MPSLRRFTGALLVALFMSASAGSAVFAQTQPPNAVPPRVVAPTRLPNTGDVDTSSDSVIPLSIGFALVGVGFGVRALGRKRRISLDRG